MCLPPVWSRSSARFGTVTGFEEPRARGEAPAGVFTAHQPGEVAVRKVKAGPGWLRLVAPLVPEGDSEGHGGAAEEKRGSAVLQACPGCSLSCEPAWCLLHGLAAPRRLAASCTALPEARRSPWPREVPGQ